MQYIIIGIYLIDPICINYSSISLFHSNIQVSRHNSKHCIHKGKYSSRYVITNVFENNYYT